MSSVHTPVHTAVLLAAGRGTRLRPYTDTTPKPLLPWQGRPTVDHILESLHSAGIKDVVLVVNYLGEQIEQWAALRDTPERRVRCVYQTGLGGTADAVQAAMPVLSQGPVLVTATDYLVDATFYADLLDHHRSHDADASVSLKRLPEAELSARSSVRFGDGDEVLEVVEKPEPGKAPSAIGANLVFVFPRAVIDLVPEVPVGARGEREVQSALNAWLAKGGRCRGLIQTVPPEWQPPPAATP